jgi:UDP-N-acetylglucosamine--N-acetylmuramyl-(pentapeptide) pyrophosphoryl-undecaprenol N-acetylglucosamine transferase
MTARRTFLMAGGGTGGHVIPAIAVAIELRDRGHDPLFVGTRRGMEATLVPQAGFPIEWIKIGGLKRVGIVRTLRTLVELPLEILSMLRLIRKTRPAAVFSMGGYAAGPVVLAALISRLPLVVMEPNAMPGITNRKIGRFVTRALVSFTEAQKYFPEGRCEISGLPVRAEFFTIEPRAREGRLTVLITGGSRGSRTLNTAAIQAWPLFCEANTPVRFLHQTGESAWNECDAAFRAAGLEGEVLRFIEDMPQAFREADLIVCRSGAGAVAELAAAGKAAVLVPFPFAADDHQRKNAEVFERAGAARMVLDEQMNGQRLFDEVTELGADRDALEAMGKQARTFARPGAGERAADLLEEFAQVA